MINRLTQKGSYASMKVDPIINVLITNEVKAHLQIFDNSIVTFGLRGLYLGVLNISHVESLYMFRKSVVDKVKLDICMFKKT